MCMYCTFKGTPLLRSINYSPAQTTALNQLMKRIPLNAGYGAPFVKILYLTDLAQKVLSLRRLNYLCMQRCYLWQR